MPLPIFHAHTRRKALLALLAVCALGTALAQAQTPAWPSKTVKFVNSWPAGGPSDILARAVGDVLQKQYGQAFIIDNKPGAAGNLGADMVAKSPADGHTLLWGIDTTHTINPHLYKAMPFKDSDLKPLVLMSSSGLLLGMHPGTGLKSAKDWMQAARERPLNFSSGGNGSPGHLWVNTANLNTGTRLVHVPYRGNTPAVMAVLAGEVDGGTLAIPGMLAHVKAGKITPLAVTSRQRSRLLPEVPTVGELGLKELETEVYYVVMAPANTPEALMQTMAKAITSALTRPELQARLQELDMHYEGLTDSAAAQRLKQLSSQYGRVVRATGMKVD